MPSRTRSRSPRVSLQKAAVEALSKAILATAAAAEAKAVATETREAAAAAAAVAAVARFHAAVAVANVERYEERLR